jgi:hypothetical protein
MDESLTGAMEALARLTATARGGGLTQAATLASLSSARRLAAQLERGELALIEAARGGGATWQIGSSGTPDMFSSLCIFRYYDGHHNRS